MSKLWTCSAAVVLGLCSLAAAQVTVVVQPSLGPSMHGSPSFAAYATQAVNALREGKTQAGAADNPSAYAVARELELAQILVGPVALWQGKPAPAGTFAAERGNRLHFGLHVKGNGQRFRLADIAYTVTSGDPGQLLASQGDLKDLAYSAGRVGIDYGQDRKPGTADDILFQDGEPATVPVDELVYVGVGVGVELDPRHAGKPDAERIQQALAAINTHREFPLAIQYTVRGESGNTLGQGSAQVTLAPPPGEPSPWPLFIGIFAALAVVGGMFAYKKNRRGPISVADKI